VKFLVLRTFLKDYRKLPKAVQREAEEKLRLLAQDPRHPSLRIKKIRRTEGLWEGSVTMAYRFTFHKEAGNIVLGRIGTHDILKKESR
jgi:mRNA interferase RelE/StbE